MFFSIIAFFSAFYPWYQKQRALGAKWTRFYPPLMLISVAFPLSLMGGTFRPVLAAVALLFGLYLGWKALRTAPA